MSAEIRSEIQKLSKIQLRQEDFIGQGGHALVYRCKILNTPIAVKCFQTQEKAQDEMNILQGIQNLVGNCPGILECYGMKKIQIEMQSEISQKYVIFLQACEIDLQKKLLMMQKLSTPQIVDLFSQLCLSLLCIHLNNCFHGDIKPANIFVNKNNQQLSCYFGDFGEGKITGTYISIDFETLSLRGTPFYLSPELWKILNERKSAGNYDPLSADIYALAITILQMLVPQKFLYDLTAARGNQQQYEKQVLKIKEELLKIAEFQNNSGNQLSNAILGMVNFDPLQRPSAVEICFEIVQSKQLCMNALSAHNKQALTAQLIKSLYWQKKQKKEQVKSLEQSLEKQGIIINNFDSEKKALQQQIKNLEQSLEKQRTIIKNLQIELQEQNKTKQIEQIIPKSLDKNQLPTFNSDILPNQFYSTIILALFKEENIQLVKLHQQLNINNNFNPTSFHQECDNRGPTLTIMQSNQEPNSFFGGMAAFSWNSSANYICDPAEECSWLFKIEIQQKKVCLHKWQCINKQYAGYGHSNYGPSFGLGRGYAEYLGGGSNLPLNNGDYKKVNLAQSQGYSLLLELSKRSQVNYPSKVEGPIMNENYQRFKVNELEIFAIKK